RVIDGPHLISTPTQDVPGDGDERTSQDEDAADDTSGDLPASAVGNDRAAEQGQADEPQDQDRHQFAPGSTEKSLLTVPLGTWKTYRTPHEERNPSIPSRVHSSSARRAESASESSRMRGPSESTSSH